MNTNVKIIYLCTDDFLGHIKRKVFLFGPSFIYWKSQLEVISVLGTAIKIASTTQKHNFFSCVDYQT